MRKLTVTSLPMESPKLFFWGSIEIGNTIDNIDGDLKFLAFSYHFERPSEGFFATCFATFQEANTSVCIVIKYGWMRHQAETTEKTIHPFV